MPFIEAFRQFQFRVGRENFCSIHVSLVPQPKATGEHKTKPTQASVRELRGLGISPDMIVCRSEKPIDESVKEKISNFCHVDPQKVINIHDCPTIYHVPLVLRQQGLVDLLNDRLQFDMRIPKKFMKKWRVLADRYCSTVIKLVLILYTRWRLKTVWLQSSKRIWNEYRIGSLRSLRNMIFTNVARFARTNNLI